MTLSQRNQVSWKSNPTTAKNGNIAKVDSYREAKRRISSAMEEGYYTEAAALIESILSDRILSHLHGAHQFPLRTRKGREHSLSDLTKAARQYETLADRNGEELVIQVDNWNKRAKCRRKD